MLKSQVKSFRNAVRFLKTRGEVLVVGKEVDPIYEVAGIQKALDGGPCLLFENIKGYGNVRNVGNLFGKKSNAASLFGFDSSREFKLSCRKAINHPVPPRMVGKAVCQEVVITGDLDVMSILPVLKHTERDGGRIMGGLILVGGEYFKGGRELSFKRMNFRGKDWASIKALRGTHFGDLALKEHRGTVIPLTVNIGAPPAVLLAGGGGSLHAIVPSGVDEVAIAGGLQQAPVSLVKAKTVEACAIAEAEWVIEGYVDTAERVWETDEAEKIGKFGAAPFFPEWAGYMGWAVRTLKFHATAVTHRKDNPIFYSPLARSFEGDNLVTIFREASFLELAERLYPGFVQDVNILHGVTAMSGVVFQVRKGGAEEGFQRNLITAAFAASPTMRMVIVVDDDIDIYNAEDVLWAITTRCQAGTGIIKGAGGRRIVMFPTDILGAHGDGADFLTEAGIGIDATVSLKAKAHFERAHYPVDKIDLKKWFNDAQLAKARSMQSDYGKLLGATGR
ncbi:MAG: UbiD family decarboxylase [Desulfobacterales bacterium]|nr:UbiD family decarboxylase [Desulfobacterales bacterium]